jgi:hypothetical protein
MSQDRPILKATGRSQRVACTWIGTFCSSGDQDRTSERHNVTDPGTSATGRRVFGHCDRARLHDRVVPTMIGRRGFERQRTRTGTTGAPPLVAEQDGGRS